MRYSSARRLMSGHAAIEMPYAPYIWVLAIFLKTHWTRTLVRYAQNTLNLKS